MLNNQKQLRRIFQDQYLDLDYRKQRDGDFKTDTRVAWCDFVDYMHRDGQITDRLAQSATL
jgi:hypothetical protein